MHFPGFHALAFAIAASLPIADALAQAPAPGFRVYGRVSSNQSHLLDSAGNIVHTWNSGFRPGLAMYLTDDGSLMRTINTNTTFLAGAGGGVQRLGLDGTVLWDFRYNSGGSVSHHDIEVLPNGNVLMIAWETKTSAEAIAQGRNPAFTSGGTFRLDHIIEVQPTGPTSGTIVWEWHLWDHLTQDFNASQANFGVVGDHPELADINYPGSSFNASDWNHCNGLDYDPVHDWIVLSVRNFNEIWILDHSTTTAEAAGHTGGNAGKGGDILYRWGNPQAYRRGTSANQQLFGQHSPTFVPEGYPGAGNIVGFNNLAPGGAAAYEIVLPIDRSGNLFLGGTTYGPAAPVWTYSGGFSSSVMSSVKRLPNGNTLICAASQGRIIEVSPASQQVFLKNVGGSTFHATYTDRKLWADSSTISGPNGGSVQLDTIGGAAHGGDTYVMIAGASGTTPGTPLGQFTLPLNFDALSSISLTIPNSSLFMNTFGTLNEFGRATSSFDLTAGLIVPAAFGAQLHFATLMLDSTTLAISGVSNAVPVTITP